MPKYITWIVNLLLLGISCLFSVLFIEFSVRIFMPHDDIAEWYQPHPKYHHTLKPDFYQQFHYQSHDAVMTVQTDAAGFRELDAKETNGDEIKVLFLGDSFVFGYGLEIHTRIDSFLRVLAKEHGISLTTVNWGVPGWGTSQETLYAADHLKDELPDILVLLFCNNDPANDRGYELPALPNTKSPLFPVKTWLRRYSHLYRWLLELRAMKQHSPQGKENDVRLKENDGISEEDWCNTRALMLQLYRDYEKIYPQVFMLLIAAAPEDSLVKENLENIADNGERLFYIDLMPFIKNIPVKDRVMPWDGHWSPAVHEAAANAIMDWVEENIQALQ